MTMDEDSKDHVSTVADITPIQFAWDETNTTVGIIAQEIGSIDLSDYSIATGVGLASVSVGSVGSVGIGVNNWANGSSISFAGSATLKADTTEYGKNTIKTANSTIDIDELADMMETLKKRLLILTPNFEQLEKYPMLKAAYDEFKMLEKLLGEPNDDT